MTASLRNPHAQDRCVRWRQPAQPALELIAQFTMLDARQRALSRDRRIEQLPRGKAIALGAPTHNESRDNSPNARHERLICEPMATLLPLPDFAQRIHRDRLRFAGRQMVIAPCEPDDESLEAWTDGGEQFV